jgi:hypothetical protein
MLRSFAALALAALIAAASAAPASAQDRFSCKSWSGLGKAERAAVVAAGNEYALAAVRAALASLSEERRKAGLAQGSACLAAAAPELAREFDDLCARLPEAGQADFLASFDDAADRCSREVSSGAFD